MKACNKSALHGRIRGDMIYEIAAGRKDMKHALATASVRGDEMIFYFRENRSEYDLPKY